MTQPPPVYPPLESATYGALPVEIDPTAWFGRIYTPPSPLDVGSIQQQLANQLGGFLAQAAPSIKVFQFPDFDLDAWWAGTAPAFMLICYIGTQMSKPLDTSAMLQERTLEFDVLIEARQTAWATFGANSPFVLIDSVEAALSGFRPMGCRNAYFEDERFTEQDPQGRVWIYRMSLKVATMRPKLEPKLVLANLARYTNLIATFSEAVPAPMTISPTGTLTLPADTIVVSVLDANNTAARLGADYNFNATTGAFTITRSGVLTPGMAVQVATVPVIDIQQFT